MRACPAGQPYCCTVQLARLPCDRCVQVRVRVRVRVRVGVRGALYTTALPVSEQSRPHHSWRLEQPSRVQRSTFNPSSPPDPHGGDGVHITRNTAGLGATPLVTACSLVLLSCSSLAFCLKVKL